MKSRFLVAASCAGLVVAGACFSSPTFAGSVCETSVELATKSHHGHVVCAGDPSGSLDDRLQALAYQVVSHRPDDNTAQVLMARGLLLNVDRLTGWFEITRGDDLIVEGELTADGDSETLSVTVEFYGLNESTDPQELEAVVFAGTLPGEIVLQMTVANQFVDASVMLDDLHTNFAATRSEASQPNLRDAIDAPQLLRGTISGGSIISGEAVMLSVLAAMQGEVITPEPKADHYMIALRDRLDELGFNGRIGTGNPIAQGDNSIPECLDACNDIWDPIIQQTLDERTNAEVIAQVIRDEAQDAYQTALANALDASIDCNDDANGGYFWKSVGTIAFGVPLTAWATIAAAGPTVGAAAAPAFVTGTAGITSGLTYLAWDADAAHSSCSAIYGAAIDAAKATRDAQFANADAMVQLAEDNVNDAVDNLANCAASCND